MKSTYYIALLSLISFFSSCKKDKFNTINSEKELSVNLVLAAPDVEETGYIAASFNGKYIYTIQKNEFIYFSKDHGESWDNMFFSIGRNRDYEKNLKISDGGYSILEGSNGSAFYLVNLNSKSIDEITAPVTFSSNAKVYVGKEDYLYFIYQTGVYYKKISSSTWEELDNSTDELGMYVGQESTKGGIAFYNGSTQKLHIHNPSDNSITSKTITIDMTQIPSNGKPASSGKNSFDGKNYLAFANDNGVAIANVSSGAVRYKGWGEFDITTSQVQDITVDGKGTVYIKWDSRYNKNLLNYFVLENNTLTKSEISRGAVFTAPDYTYYYGTFKLHKIYDGKEEQFYSVNKENKREKTKINSVALANDDIFLLLDGALYKQAAHSESFELIKDAEGIKFIYLYADGNKIRAYGGTHTAHSDDGGNTWLTTELDADVKIVSYIAQSGNTYYGMELKNQGGVLGATGFTYSAFSLTVLSSSDAIHWEEYSPTLTTNGYAPTAMSADGIITYSVNVNPMGNIIMEGYSTHDFGKSWQRNDNIVGFNGVFKNELLSVNNGTLIRFDKSFKKLSEQELVFDDDFDFKGSGAHSVIPDSKGNIYFVYLSKLYRIKRS